MWGRLAAGAAALLAFALVAFLGHQLIAAYGNARQAAGRASAEAAQLPAVLAAQAAAANAGLAARDKIIAADSAHAAELSRLLPLLLTSRDKVNAYAQTDAGRATCLAGDRVHDIENDRARLFDHATETADGQPGTVSADAAPDTARPQLE